MAPLQQLIRERQEKLAAIRERGVDPYPRRFPARAMIQTACERFAQSGSEPVHEQVRVAGRLVACRPMGKVTFGHLMDASGRLQVYFKEEVVGTEAYKLFDHAVDVGDFLGVEGRMFRTRTGELTLRAETVTILSKALRPLPEKWHGLRDVETRYRQRYLDLIANREVYTASRQRCRFISAIRQALERQGFIEVETPIMQPQAGGATARPFVTHHNAFDVDLHLRVAPELYLKRLLVGGYEKIFELGRVFRNEGVDNRHNPEFTILEVYQALANYEDMMELCEFLLTEVTQTIVGSLTLTREGRPLSLAAPFRRVSLFELTKQATGKDLRAALEAHRLRSVASELGVPADDRISERQLFDRIVESMVISHLWEPTFILDYPKAFSPLAKSRADDPGLVERFELYIGGEEVANAYSELNDPAEQRDRLQAQMLERQAGDEEAHVLDEEFLEALEYGMPPAGGLGIGVDRLAMLLLGHTSIREVILFPLLRPRSSSPPPTPSSPPPTPR
ncbi:MAG: lysine--tRNA ligase [Elusimicrobia bacterium]|nr:lysine--tRNA ligase [Elusimicrobiota bacterium]